MMHKLHRILSVLVLLALASYAAAGQADKKEVRAGNRKFKKDNYREAEIDYRRAVLKDSLSVAASYDLASSLYRQENWDGAGEALQKVKDIAPAGPYAADWHYNSGDVALQKKDYAAAVKAFRESLLLHPDDLDAKENYIYAKKMLENQQGGGGGGDNQQNQDQQQDQQNQDQQQDQQNQDQQNQDQQNQDQQNQEQDQQGQDQQEQKITPQQAQQMLRAIQAKEKETQDKVNKEKAAALKSRQKEKNW